jgi:hypothetical protein
MARRAVLSSDYPKSFSGPINTGRARTDQMVDKTIRVTRIAKSARFHKQGEKLGRLSRRKVVEVNHTLKP